MRLVTYSIGVLVFVIVLSSCNALESTDGGSYAERAPVAATPYPDGARRITIDELESLVKDGKVLIVDVRSQDAYDMGHIPGARLIPLDVIAERTKELPKDKLIVTYCS